MEKKAKTSFFDKELQRDEIKTINTLIGIGKQGKVVFLKKSNSEINKETEIERTTQYKMLKRLVEKNILKKEGTKYQLKNEYKDLAYGSLIKERIIDLEKSGIFPFNPYTIVGLKDKKEYIRYPEIQHLHEAMMECRYQLYRIKQIKAIFLVREFIPIWNSFLKTDIDPVVKYAMWEFVIDSFSILNIQKNQEGNYVNKQLKFVTKLKKLKKDVDVEKIKKHLEKEYRTFLREQKLGKNKNFNDLDFLLSQGFISDKKLIQKIREYKKLYSKGLIDYIQNNLSKEKIDKILAIIEYVNICYHKELTRLGFWADLEQLDAISVVGPIHWKKTFDDAEKIFRMYDKSRYFGKIKNLFKDDIKKEEVDEKLLAFKDLYDERNYDRLRKRLEHILAYELEEPKPIIFSTPRLQDLRKEIINLAKKEKKFFPELSNAPDSGIDVFMHIIYRIETTSHGSLTKANLLGKKSTDELLKNMSE